MWTELNKINCSKLVTYVEDVERCKDDEGEEEGVVIKDGEGGGFVLGNLESKRRNELNLYVH